MANTSVTSANGLSPLFSPSLQGQKRRQTRCGSSSPHITDNDDIRERHQRRRNRLNDIDSPLAKELSSPSNKPRLSQVDSSADGFSNAQLKEHYSSCIKLSTENKITAKNAFALHLIDYMADVVKNQGGATNFQIASCTLDASAKIYAGRIDSVHSEAYKVLGGLGRSEDKEKNQEQNDTEDNDKARRKNIARKVQTIEENVNSLNAEHIDLQFEVDPLFQKNSAAFDESGTAGLLLYTLNFNDDTMNEISINSNILANTTKCHLKVENKESLSEKTVDISEWNDYLRNLTNDDLIICPEVDCLTSKGAYDSNQNATTDNQNLNHTFTANLSDSSIQQYGYVDSEDDDDANDIPNKTIDDVRAQIDFTHDQEAIQLDGNNAMGTMLRPMKDPKLFLESALKLSEYSYFNNAFLATWAGPKHWKLQPMSRELKSTDKHNKPTGQKKVPFKIDFSAEIDFEKHFSKGKSAVKLSKATLKGRSSDQTTLPEDLHYEADSLFLLFTKPKMMVKWHQSNGISVEDDSNWYDYNNPNDRQNYCPNVAVDYDDDDDDDCGDNFESDQTQYAQSINAHSGFNLDVLDDTQLVSEPKKVNKIEINYAKTAKKVDVRKLKAAMWGTLCDQTEDTKQDNKENYSNENMIQDSSEHEVKLLDKVTTEQSFKQLYHNVPKKISGSTAKNLSVPICFVCLLHLANEKNLQITGDESMSDLVISQPEQ